MRPAAGRPPPTPRPHTRLGRTVRPRAPAIAVPILAVFTALVLGALVILISGGNPILAYAGLYEGAIGCPGALSRGEFAVDQLVCGRSIADWLVTATPFVIAGLAVAVPFKAGLFNIGVEGQLLAGSLGSVVVGYSFSDLPAIVHLPLALAAGVLAGAIWGGIPGVLKAVTGAHEVIVTIMLNYIAATMTSFLLAGLLKDPRSPAVARTRYIAESAKLPDLDPDPSVLIHLGVPIALLTAFVIWWLLYQTTLGFRIRTAGANPDAARYAGISVRGAIVWSMAIGGGLAGLAGAVEVTGVNFYHTPGFSSGYGFDSIAIALLGHAHPIGVVPAALLFGGLRAGSSRMQFLTQIPSDIIFVIQALVLIFVAAPAIVRWIYRLRPGRVAVDPPALGGAPEAI